MLLREISAMSQLLFLGWWAEQYAIRPTSDINVFGFALLSTNYRIL
jgi:hypothetical protein